MNTLTNLDEARQYLAQGKIIAYPTEAVYGLGCDPFNQQAVEKLLVLKQRSVTQGLIILIANWSQLAPLIGQLPNRCLDDVHGTWPGPVTWIFPKSNLIPMWVSGQHESIAIRMSAHPVARSLCANGPIVSTSANLSGQKPATEVSHLEFQFPQGIDALVAGQLGGALQPSVIYDVLTGRKLR